MAMRAAVRAIKRRNRIRAAAITSPFMINAPTRVNRMTVPFRCKSRVCNCCGYQYQRYRAEKIKSKLINCNHRHIVFTIAEELRVFFLLDRNLLNLLFKSTADTISSWLKRRNKSQNLTCGMISTLHTFGRDLKWNPHIHMLVSLCAKGNGIPFKLFNFIPFEMLRKRFMTTLLLILELSSQMQRFIKKDFMRCFPI
jgi:hypothetical protein